MYLRFNSCRLFMQIGDIKEPKKSTIRRDKLIGMEQRARKIWDRYGYFTVEVQKTKQKYFQTFPYAYMNGKLHLGHAFSMTKCDFNAWYKRLCGFNVLFPFGFHCTGMPISAASLKLKQQLQTYGNPPIFPKQPIEEIQVKEQKQQKSKKKADKKQKGDENKNQKKQKKMYQYNILSLMKIPAEQMKFFIDPVFWVEYFPPKGRSDLIKFGTHIDLQRSFITTSLNPFYNSLIEWQFNTLKSKGYLKFGKRASIYSPYDEQMCADHDREEGEGINPQQYTLIKLQVIKMNEKMLQKLANRKVYLVAATLRPETMYGQTNCYLLPTGEYCAVEMLNDQIFICTEKSARNMAYQNLTKQEKKVSILCKFQGDQMMGLPLKAPLSVYQIIYTLPMLTISMKKGTGVVSCVPSDSPDDWMAITDLRAKKPLRDKYKITQQMVSLQPVQIISIPKIGNLSAVTLCEQMKIKSQNQRELLDKAKDDCYKKGFHEGTMLLGTYKGSKVSDAKNLVRTELLKSGQALIYYEPNGHVVSRSGDECVVAYCDQWYINYGDQNWKQSVIKYIQDKSKFTCNSEIVFQDLLYTCHWLKQWGCSRSFGLGTKMPFDKQYLIQSLSDSTIYFAYYTIAHLLQGNLNGSQLGILGIKSEDINDDFWSYVLLGTEYTSKKIPISKLQKLRQSFLYWYPLDLRCSGKDLIKNHLTMSLFNHAAIWDDDAMWPKSFFCNGFINVQGQKMSKSKGNFIILEDIINQYGADSSRMACALAGDTINDANFTQQIANASIMQLSTLQMYLTKVNDQKLSFRSSEDQVSAQVHYFDEIFSNQMQEQINKVRESYQKMIYRDVVKYGFHDFVGFKDLYTLNCDHEKPKKSLIERYIYLQLLFLYPICPHFTEVAYLDYFLTFIENAEQYPNYMGQLSFPKPKMVINYNFIRAHQYIVKFLISMRDSYHKVSKPKKGQIPKFTKAIIIYRYKFQLFQINILNILKNSIDNSEIKVQWRKDVKIEVKEELTKALKFGAFVEKQYKSVGQQAFEENLPFDEFETLNLFDKIIRRDFPLSIQIIQVHKAPERQNKGWKQSINDITPGNPLVIFE